MSDTVIATDLDGIRLELTPRIVKTEGFERLFSHYTGLVGDELLKYLQDFQARALKVSDWQSITEQGLSISVHRKWRLRRA